jgi:flagellar hook-associated protein 1 FlgK
MSTFSGLSTALSALYANRQGMETSAHNIANVNTPGYSRQRVELKAIAGPSIPGVSAQATTTGSGVMVENVQRLRDAFLDNRVRVEHGLAENLAGKQQMLGRIEQAFAEPGDTALQSQLTQMWSAFGDLANRPADSSARVALIAQATIVADSMQGIAGQLASNWDSGREQLDTLVVEINQTARAVADLNKAVITGNATGQPANDLADQRDLLVIKLAELTGARATPRPDGSVDLQLNGSTLVAGGNARALNPPAGAFSLAAVQAGAVVQLTWSDGDNAAATAPSGRLAATMEALNTTVAGYANRLDGVARDLARVVNTQHAAGVKDNGAPGGPFFGPDPVTADTIKVEIAGPADLAVADATAEPGSKDGGNADKLADLAKDKTGPDRAYRQLVVDLGVEAQTTNRRVGIQAHVVSEVDAATLGASGVNLDEEMTNLVAFERAFQAAAKVISTIDEMLDTLINRMGR